MGDQRLPNSVSRLLHHVQEQALSTGSERLTCRLVRLLHCVTPRVTDSNSPKVLDIDLNVVRPLCFDGVPDEVPALRAALWKLLLGYLPCDSFSWDKALSSKRLAYAGFLRELSAELPLNACQSDSHWTGMGNDNSDENNKVLPLEVVLDQIRKDIFRTRPDMDFFGRSLSPVSSSSASPAPLLEGHRRNAVQLSESTLVVMGRDPECIDVVNPKSHYDAMARVLLLYAKLNPGVQYVQGMNELCAPIYFLFAQDPLNYEHAEADTFFTFSLLMAGMRDSFVKALDHTEGGMLGRISKFSDLLQEKDEELWQHLESVGVSPVYYTVRWLTLMLTQELDMAGVLRLWDSLLSDLARPHSLLQYFCVAMVIGIREVLLAGDFTDCMRMLHHYPPVPIDDLLTAAFKLRSADLTQSCFSSGSEKAAPGDRKPFWWPWQ